MLIHRLISHAFAKKVIVEFSHLLLQAQFNGVQKLNFALVCRVVRRYKGDTLHCLSPNCRDALLSIQRQKSRSDKDSCTQTALRRWGQVTLIDMKLENRHLLSDFDYHRSGWEGNDLAGENLF